MRLDNINLLIIKAFFELGENEKVSLSTIRDKIYPRGLTKTEKISKLIFIRDRLLTMPNEIFKVTQKENRIRNYELQYDHVGFGNVKFPEGVKKCIFLKLEGFWKAFEL